MLSGDNNNTRTVMVSVFWISATSVLRNGNSTAVWTIKHKRHGRFLVVLLLFPCDFNVLIAPVCLLHQDETFQRNVVKQKFLYGFWWPACSVPWLLQHHSHKPINRKETLLQNSKGILTVFKLLLLFWKKRLPPPALSKSLHGKMY